MFHGSSASLVAQLVKNLPAMQETLVQFLGQEDPLEKGQVTHSSIHGLPWWLRWLKNLPAMKETWEQSLGWEDPLEEGMATHSSILAWRIPMGRVVWRATVHGVPESDTIEQLSAQHNTMFHRQDPLRQKTLLVIFFLAIYNG